MVLTIGEVKWRLHFHSKTVALNGPTNPKGLWDVVTTCLVHSGPCIDGPADHGQETHCVNGLSGVARCSRKDGFNRRVGHRLALTRAISQLPVETRKLIWQAYWLRTRRPKESSQKFRQRIDKASSIQAA